MRAEWNGEGLPPVGCECEIKRALEWLPCKIVFISDFHVIVQAEEEICWQTQACQFRLVRSEAERKREETIADLQNALGHAHGLFDLAFLYNALTSGSIRHITLK